MINSTAIWVQILPRHVERGSGVWFWQNRTAVSWTHILRLSAFPNRILHLFEADSFLSADFEKEIVFGQTRCVFRQNVNWPSVGRPDALVIVGGRGGDGGVGDFSGLHPERHLTLIYKYREEENVNSCSKHTHLQKTAKPIWIWFSRKHRARQTYHAISVEQFSVKKWTYITKGCPSMVSKRCPGFAVVETAMDMASKWVRTFQTLWTRNMRQIDCKKRPFLTFFFGFPMLFLIWSRTWVYDDCSLELWFVCDPRCLCCTQVAFFHSHWSSSRCVFPERGVRYEEETGIIWLWPEMDQQWVHARLELSAWTSERKNINGFRILNLHPDTKTLILKKIFAQRALQHLSKHSWPERESVLVFVFQITNSSQRTTLCVWMRNKQGESPLTAKSFAGETKS